jgi:hypothetical protein
VGDVHMSTASTAAMLMLSPTARPASASASAAANAPLPAAERVCLPAAARYCTRRLKRNACGLACHLHTPPLLPPLRPSPTNPRASYAVLVRQETARCLRDQRAHRCRRPCCDGRARCATELVVDEGSSPCESCSIRLWRAISIIASRRQTVEAPKAGPCATVIVSIAALSGV